MSVKRSKSIQSIPRLLRVSIVVVVLISVLGGGTLFAYGQTVKDEIHPGVVVAGTQLGGLTLSQAKAALEARVHSYQRSAAYITVGTVKKTVNLDRLGVSINVAATVDKAFRVGRSSMLATLSTLPIIRKVIPVDPIVTIDQQVLSKYVSNIVAQATIPATNASITFVDGKTSVVSEKNGSTVEADPNLSTITDSATNLETIELSFPAKVIKPAVSAKDIQHVVKNVDEMVDSPMTVRYGKSAVLLKGADLTSLLVIKTVADTSHPLEFSVDQSQLQTLLTSLHTVAYVAPKDAVGYAGEVEGEYAYKNFVGRDIDWQSTSAKLLEALQDSKASSIDAVVSEVKPNIKMLSVTAPKPQGKVIAVDLAHQSVFAFEDGKLKFWTHGSTGKGAYATPTGEWKVYAKTPVQVMDGPGYYLPNVKWVMPYNGDYTLHTAYWHTNFGHPMSHGCTNLSENDAKWLYDWTPIGTPVVIYNSDEA